MRKPVAANVIIINTMHKPKRKNRIHRLFYAHNVSNQSRKDEPFVATSSTSSPADEDSDAAPEDEDTPDKLDAKCTPDVGDPEGKPDTEDPEGKPDTGDAEGKAD